MSSLSVSLVDSIIANFPSQPDKIRGEPNYQKLTKLHDDIKANASSIPSRLGGGAHGYLGVVLTAAAYAATIAPAVALFVVPPDPGPLAVIPAGAAAAVREQLIDEHKEATRQMKEYESVTKALRKQIVSSIEETYIKPLKTRNNGYNAVSVESMMTYLFTAYGNIDDESIMVNEKKMIESWDGSSPFENVIERIDECVDFAEAAGQPYTAPQILSKIYTLVYDTGLYFDACEKWKDLPAANQTYADFKMHFLKAQRTHRNQQRTMKQSSYGLSVARMEEMADKFAGYVAVDRAEKDTERNNVLKTLNNIEAQHAKEVAQHAKEMAEIKALMLKMGQPTPGIGPAATTRIRTPAADNGSYCWSHGYLVHSQHTSATCRNKKEGHIDGATRSNNVGGSQRGKPATI
jgi:predicted metalloprotease